MLWFPYSSFLFEFEEAAYLKSVNQLRAYCRKHHEEDYYLLKNILGIGGFLASVIIAECGDIRRFSNENQFASFIGLVPEIYVSGDSENPWVLCQEVVRNSEATSLKQLG